MSEWYRRSVRSIAQHTGTNSKRASSYVKGVFPTHISHGVGCRIIDEDFKPYIDFVSGLGTNILGYGNPFISEAVHSALKMGPSLSLPTSLEVEAAEALSRFTGYPKIRFYKTGTEACMAAVRIARSVNRGDVVYSDGYHGWSDLFVSLTPPALGVKDSFKVTTKLNDFLNTYINVGAVILEPLKLDLEADRAIANTIFQKAKEYKTPVIYDEVVTGFRVPDQFISKNWGNRPDIMVLGKAIANGFPLSAVCMTDEMADNEWFCSSTYSGEIVSLKAMMTTLELLQRKKVDDLWFYANRFMNNANKLLEKIGVKIQGYGTRGFMPLESLNEALFIQEMCKSGVIMGKAFFYGYSHMESDIDDVVLERISDNVDKIVAGKVRLEGEMPVAPFKRY